MAIETLDASLRQAAEVGGLTGYLQDVQNILEPKLTLLGAVKVDGQSYPAYDAATTSLDPAHPDLCRGGTRIAIGNLSTAEAIDTVMELGKEMGAKQAGLHELAGGRKGLVVVPDKPSKEVTTEIMRQTAELMLEHELAGPYGHIISSDMNTGGYTYHYAKRIHELQPDLSKWRATAAGKPVEHGGLSIRPEATAIGVITSLDALMSADNVDDASVVVKGFGQVGARSARRISQLHPNMRLTAVADIGGTVWTDHPAGLEVTDEMVAAYGDNPQYRGDKMRAFEAAHRQLHPDIQLHFSSDPDTSLYLPTDYLIPAAGPNEINLENAQILGARRGIIEAANGPTEPDAHAFLVASGLRIISDTVANSRGVACSAIEWSLNIAGETATVPNDEQLTAQLVADHRRNTDAVLEVARELDINDLRVAAGIVTIRNIVDLAGLAA